MKLFLLILTLIYSFLLFAENINLLKASYDFEMVMRINNKFAIRQNNLEWFEWGSIRPIEIEDSLYFCNYNLYDGFNNNKYETLYLFNSKGYPVKMTSGIREKIKIYQSKSDDYDSLLVKTIKDSLDKELLEYSEGYYFKGRTNEIYVFFNEEHGVILLYNTKTEEKQMLNGYKIAESFNIKDVLPPYQGSSIFNVELTEKYIYLFFVDTRGFSYALRRNLIETIEYNYSPFESTITISEVKKLFYIKKVFSIKTKKIKDSNKYNIVPKYIFVQDEKDVKYGYIKWEDFDNDLYTINYFNQNKKRFWTEKISRFQGSPKFIRNSIIIDGLSEDSTQWQVNEYGINREDFLNSKLLKDVIMKINTNQSIISITDILLENFFITTNKVFYISYEYGKFISYDSSKDSLHVYDLPPDCIRHNSFIGVVSDYLILSKWYNCEILLYSLKDKTIKKIYSGDLSFQKEFIYADDAEPDENLFYLFATENNLYLIVKEYEYHYTGNDSKNPPILYNGYQIKFK